MNNMLNGKNVVVLGGSSGIGLAIAVRACGAGARVTVGSRRGRPASLPSSLSANESCRWTNIDIRDPKQLRAFFDTQDTIDHLIITATQGHMAPFVELDPEKARNFFEVKFWGQLFAAYYGVSRLAATGSIIFTAGVESRKSVPGLACASAIDAAIEALTRSLAVELAPRRVNCISPGPIDTPLYETIAQDKRDAFFSRVATTYPAARVGQPEEVADAALYLMANEYTTGTVLDIDGGGKLV